MNQPLELDALELELLRAEVFERLYTAMSLEVNPTLDGHLVAFVKEWTNDFMNWPQASIRCFMNSL